MKKEEFLDELCQGLRFCSSAEEIRRTVDFYAEAIDDRMEDGMAEEEAVAAMGSVDDIVREFRSTWRREEDAEPSGERVRPGEVKRVFSGLRRIDVYDTTGEISVLPSPDGDVHIEYCATEAWRYDITGEEAVTVRRVRNGDREEKLRFDFLGRRFSVSLPSFGGAAARDLRLKLLLPPDPAVAVSVSSSSGDVEARNVSLTGLAVKLASGDVTLENVGSSGRVSVVTVSGDAGLWRVTAPEIAVSTVSGDLDLGDPRADSLELKTVSGDTEAEGAAVTEYVGAGSVSGDLSVALAVPCGRVSLDSVSGDVELDLAGAESLYTVAAKSGTGSVHVSGEPGLGPNRVRIKTMSGDIDVGFGR